MTSQCTNHLTNDHLGEGSFGKVYLMRDKSKRKLICVKVIKIKNIPKKERDATKMEVDLLRRLNHPNIVRYIDSFLSRNRESLCIAMEYCDGGDLAAQIKAARRNMFSESKILHWFVQIALGVHYMHTNNVLHRDLKTQNIFLTGNGRLVLGDLGISKVLEGTMDFAKTCIGTPYYMSPEIFKNKPYSYKSDVWALGCVLYEMTTLNHAFDSNSINGLAQKIIKGKYPPIHSKYSRQLRELIGEMLMLEPRQRPDMDQILRKPVVKKHIINFFTDIASRPSNSIGEGTMIVRVAASSSTSTSGQSTTADNDVNMLAFRKQLKSLGLVEELDAALKPRAAPTNPTEAKKAVKEVGAAVKREEDHKKMVEAALEKLRNERESRLKERNAMAANARARASSRVEEYERRKKEEAARAAAAMKPAAERRREARENRESIPSAASASNSDATNSSESRQKINERVGRRRSFGEEMNKDRERERRVSEGRRRLLEQEEREKEVRLLREEEEKARARVEEKRREDFRQMAERADAKRQAELRLREAKEEEAMNARKEMEEREEKERAERIAARERLREKERSRQRDEIEQLKKDKIELDRRTRERDRIRESRRQEERRKLEENLKQKEHISPHQRNQLNHLEEKLSAPPSRRNYHHDSNDPVIPSSSSPEQSHPNIVVAASARDKVLQKRLERQAREESERLKLLKDAEVGNRNARAMASNEGHAANGRPTNMGMEELASALKDADGGIGSRYSSVAEAKSSSPPSASAKAVGNLPSSLENDKKIRAKVRRRSFDNARNDTDDYDSNDTDDDIENEISPGGRLSDSSDIGSIESDAAGLDEDMRRREEELKQELEIATNRCSQLKATLRETKSFFQGPTSAVSGKGSDQFQKGPGGSEDDDHLMEGVDSDAYDSDVDDSMEESWTAQGVNVGDIRDMKGKQLFEGKQADEADDLESTAPRAMKIQPALAVAVQPPVYRNLSDAPSPSGRLSDRIDRLRQRCVDALGKKSFEEAYAFLKSLENDDRGMYEEDIEEDKQKKVRKILGEGKAHFMPLIEQLIFMEETHSS